MNNNKIKITSEKEFKHIRHISIMYIILICLMLFICNALNYIWLSEYNAYTYNIFFIVLGIEICSIISVILLTIFEGKKAVFFGEFAFILQCFFTFYVYNMCQISKLNLFAIIMILAIHLFKAMLWQYANIKIMRSNDLNLRALKKYEEVDIPFANNMEVDLKEIVQSPTKEIRHRRSYHLIILALLTYGSLFVYVMIQYITSEYLAVSGMDFISHSILVGTLLSMLFWIFPIVSMLMHHQFQLLAIKLAMVAEIGAIIYRYYAIYMMYAHQQYDIRPFIIVLIFDVLRYMIYLKTCTSFSRRPKALRE